MKRILNINRGFQFKHTYYLSPLKGTVSVISSDPSNKDDITPFTNYNGTLETYLCSKM